MRYSKSNMAFNNRPNKPGSKKSTEGCQAMEQYW